MPRIVACDWGYHPGKTWVGWAAATPDKRALLYRERVCSKSNIAIWGAEVARISQHERESIVGFKLDPSAWGHKGEEKTLAEQIIEATGMPFEKADNDRLGGKALMHEFLRWRPKPKSFVPPEGYDEQQAFRILRNVGPKAYREYVEMFEEEPLELGLPRLQVAKSCEAFRKTIPACVYVDAEKGKKAEDVAEFNGDDPYDGGRYLIKAIDDYFNLSSKLATKYGELGHIVQTLEKSGDWNAYYRQMAQFERKNPEGLAGAGDRSIPRHRGRFASSRLRFRPR